MFALHRAAAHGKLRAHHLIDLQALERQAGAEDVDDRINRSNFVEVDLVGRFTVHLTLGVGQPAEDPPRHTDGVRRRTGSFQNFFDICEIAMARMLGRVEADVEPAGGKPLRAVSPAT